MTELDMKDLLCIQATKYFFNTGICMYIYLNIMCGLASAASNTIYSFQTVEQPP